jgi:hypothetical protein
LRAQNKATKIKIKQLTVKTEQYKTKPLRHAGIGTRILTKLGTKHPRVIQNQKE